jgi:hypothetical protein
MRIAIHQPNFVPWFPFFYKMAMVDTFILLTHVQFEKNGFQNRFKHKDKWITKSIRSGVEEIAEKEYTGGKKVVDLNTAWIKAIAATLEIDTLITDDGLYHETRAADPTEKLIDIIRTQARYRGVEEITYITSESSKDKYLDENLMRSSGIGIEYCKVPKNLHKSTFEVFEEFGVDGAIKQLPKLCRV